MHGLKMVEETKDAKHSVKNVARKTKKSSIFAQKKLDVMKDLKVKLRELDDNLSEESFSVNLLRV